jgi:hypothetical protein
MEKLKEYVAKNRPSLSLSSINTYASILKSLYYKVFGTEELILDKFDDIDKILEFLKDSFAEYLFDDKTLEASLKLKKNVGRTKIPGPDEWPGFDYVLWIVEYMMEGFNKEKSLLLVENKLKESGKPIKLQTLRDHFDLFKYNALRDFISCKEHYDQELTEAQHQVIKDYFDE